MRDQRGLVRDGDGGDEQVIGADGRALAGEVCADDSGPFSRWRIEWQKSELPKELVQQCQVPRLILRRTAMGTII
jgi:hypothetical protein